MKKLLTALCLALGIAVLAACGANGGDNTILERDTAISDIQNYVQAEDYRAEQRDEIDALIDEYMGKINSAATQDELDALVQEAKSKLDAVKTDAELDAEEWAAVKEEAKSSLASYKDKANYRPAEQTQIEAILVEANAAIDEALTEDGVNAAVAAAKSALDEVKTAAELDAADALAAAKATAKASLATCKDKTNYRPAQQAQIEAILAEANAAIDEALTEQAIAAAVTAAQAELDAVKTDAELAAEELAALNAAKQSAKNTLAALFEETDFTEEDWAQIEEAIAAYNAQIDAKATVAEVEELLETATEALNENWLSKHAFPITAVQAQNGHITPSAERAKPGTKITFSCEADAGFRAYNGSLSVKTAGGTDVPVTRASFTMPAERVEIFVSFIKEEENGVPVRLTSPQEEDIAAHKLGWESTTATGWDGWPAEANKQSVRIEGFGYINNLTIHGMTEGEVGFTYDLEKLNARYDYFSAEVGIHFDNGNQYITTMHVIVRFQEKGSEEWGNEYKLLIYGMQSPTLIQVPIPENAAKMQLHADPGDRAPETCAKPNDYDIIVWGNPMLYNGTLGKNVDSLALATVQPTEATTAYPGVPAHNYGIKSYPGYNLLPTVAGTTYRDGFITNGSGVDGDDEGFTFNLTDYCGAGGLDTLVGFAGLQDDLNYSGEAKLVIKVDGAVKFEKVMKTGDEAAPVRIPVLGAKELKLLIVNSDNVQTCDVCVFAEMTLIREAAHPIDPNTVLLSDLEYEGSSYWEDGIPAKFYSAFDLHNRVHTKDHPDTFYTIMPKVNGATMDGGFITHSDSANPDSWYGFTFDLKDEAFERLVGYFGVLDIADIRGGIPTKGTGTKMSYKILADMGNGQFDTEIVSATAVGKDTLAAIDVSVTGAKRIQLLMSCGPDGASGDGDIGIFTGMYLTSAAKA